MVGMDIPVRNKSVRMDNHHNVLAFVGAYLDAFAGTYMGTYRKNPVPAGTDTFLRMQETALALLVVVELVVVLVPLAVLVLVFHAQ